MTAGEATVRKRGETVGMNRDDLLVKMIRAGLGLQDANTATTLALREAREQRDNLIVVARQLGHSVRTIGRMFAVDAAIVHRVLTRARGVSTPTTPTVAPVAPEPQGGSAG
jgi:hypothetical protein